MHPLARRSVTKMNGLGNEIVVLDLRGFGLSARRQERARHRPGAGPRLRPTDGAASAGLGRHRSLCPHLQSRRQRGRGLRQRHALRGLDLDARHAVRDAAGRNAQWRPRLPARRRAALFGRDGPAQVRLAGHPAGQGRRRHGRDRLPDRTGGAPMLAATVNIGNPHAIFFVNDLDANDLSDLGPELEHDRSFRSAPTFHSPRSRRAIISLERVWERGAGLTLPAARPPAPPGRGRARGPDRAARPRSSACPAATSPSPGATATIR